MSYQHFIWVTVLSLFVYSCSIDDAAQVVECPQGYIGQQGLDSTTFESYGLYDNFTAEYSSSDTSDSIVTISFFNHRKGYDQSRVMKALDGSAYQVECYHFIRIRRDSFDYSIAKDSTTDTMHFVLYSYLDNQTTTSAADLEYPLLHSVQLSSGDTSSITVGVEDNICSEALLTSSSMGSNCYNEAISINGELFKMIASKTAAEYLYVNGIEYVKQ